MSLKNFWWIASFPKSGNTWVRAFLSAYLTGACDINRLASGGAGDLHKYFYQSVSPKPIDEFTPEEMILLRPTALLHMASLSGKVDGKPHFMKTHFSNSQVEGMRVIPPQLTAGSIYLIRDPRDVAVSFADHTGQNINQTIKNMADPGHLLVNKETGLFHHTGHWSVHVRSWVEKNSLNVMAVCYEDLLEDPVKHFTSIVKHIGLPFDEIALRRAIDLTSFKKLQEQEKTVGFKEQGVSQTFFNRGKSGGWKDKLTDKQVKQIESDHAEVMEILSYPLVTRGNKCKKPPVANAADMQRNELLKEASA